MCEFFFSWCYCWAHPSTSCRRRSTSLSRFTDCLMRNSDNTAAHRCTVQLYKQKKTNIFFCTVAFLETILYKKWPTFYTNPLNGRCWLSGGSKNFERRGAEDNLSAPSSFIANVHNQNICHLHGKSGFLTKIWANKGAAPHWIRHCAGLLRWGGLLRSRTLYWIFFSNVCSSAACSRFSKLSSAWSRRVSASSPTDTALRPDRPECSTDDRTPFIWQAKHIPVNI